MKFSYNWLQSFLKKKLPEPEKLADLLTMRSFETEPPEKFGNDFILDIDVLPNRGPDCFSHIGIAREIGALLNSKFQIPNSKLKEDKKLKTKDFINVEVKDEKACPRYTAIVIRGIRVGMAPKWMRKRLEACGLRSINSIVDIANYVMLETGQPLHVFDAEKLDERKIIVRKAEKNERIVTLDDERYELNENILVIADAKKPVAIAGIKGGKIPEVDKKTRTVVVESANFSRKSIRKTSKKIDLRTDASWRFEHGLDIALVEKANARAAFLIQEISGGSVASGMVDTYKGKFAPVKIKLYLDYVSSLLGVETSKEKIVKILESLDFKITKSSPKYLIIDIPSFRKDILIQEDLIEEIGRIYGYEKIEAKLPVIPMCFPGKNSELLWQKKIKEMFRGFGFFELYLYSFISDKDSELLKPVLKENSFELLKIEKPLSSSTAYLRPSLLFNLLKIFDLNQKEKSNINVFEIGKIYYKEKTIKERKMLAGLVTGKDKFYELKGVFESLFLGLGTTDFYFDSYSVLTPEIFWQEGSVSEIKIRDRKIGVLGKIKKEIFDFYKVSGDIFAFEIDFEKLIEFAEEEHEYRPPSPYPEMIQDLAVIVPSKILAGEVIRKMHLAGGKLVRDIEIFDIYEGAPLPKGKKNFAFHIIYQSKNKTLTSKEVDEAQEKIIKILERDLTWRVRKQ